MIEEIHEVVVSNSMWLRDIMNTNNFSVYSILKTAEGIVPRNICEMINVLGGVCKYGEKDSSMNLYPLKIN